MTLTIRQAREDDFLRVHAFIDRCEILVTHPEHVYRIILRYFADSCYVAERDDEIVGFQMGFLSQRHPGTYFLWQIGTDPALRRQGVGRALLAHAEKDLRDSGCERIEVTIDPENVASVRMFEQRGYVNISRREGDTVEVNSVPAVKDYYRPGRHFVLLEKVL